MTPGPHMATAGALYGEACAHMRAHRNAADSLAWLGEPEAARESDRLAAFWQGEALRYAHRPAGELVPLF